MIYISIGFDSHHRIICSSHQIHRQHPWMSKTIFQNRVSSANSYSHYSQMFLKICVILFSYLVKYIFRFWHLFLFALAERITSLTKCAYARLQFDVKTVNNEGKLCIVLSELQERRSASNSIEKCFHIPYLAGLD